MINNYVKITLEAIAFCIIIYIVYSYDKLYNYWKRKKEEIVRSQINSGDKYIEEINKLTNYKG